jgi:LacI family transcriptional regulator
MSEKHPAKVTIADIARQLGTSAATVSRVLSGNGYPVNKKLREQILTAAHDMGYVPVNMRQKETKSYYHEIGVVVPTVKNPYFADVVVGIEVEARRMDYSVLLYSSLRDTHNESVYVNNLLSRQVEGLIIFPMGSTLDFISHVPSARLPMICIDQTYEGFSGSSVGFNYVKAGAMATEHLIGLGHRRIAFLTTPLVRQSRKEVYDGYQLELSRASIPLDQSLVLEASREEERQDGSYEFTTGQALAAELLMHKNFPTAVVAINDLTAYGVMNEFQKHGLQIPQDISVIGLDNLETSAMIYPPLTTINQPAGETGRLACKLLIDAINGTEKSHAVNIVLEPELVVRRSTRPAVKSSTF